MTTVWASAALKAIKLTLLYVEKWHTGQFLLLMLHVLTLIHYVENRQGFVWFGVVSIWVDLLSKVIIIIILLSLILLLCLIVHLVSITICVVCCMFPLMVSFYTCQRLTQEAEIFIGYVEPTPCNYFRLTIFKFFIPNKFGHW